MSVVAYQISVTNYDEEEYEKDEFRSNVAATDETWGRVWLTRACNYEIYTIGGLLGILTNRFCVFVNELYEMESDLVEYAETISD